MDRLDYLQRDSHFLGVQYGRIEAARIIANLEIAQLSTLPRHPSETVGDRDLPVLMSSLDGETRFSRGAHVNVDALHVPDGTPSFPIDGLARASEPHGFRARTQRSRSRPGSHSRRDQM
jgi:hypothetical protein